MPDDEQPFSGELTDKEAQTILGLFHVLEVAQGSGDFVECGGHLAACTHCAGKPALAAGTALGDLECPTCHGRHLAADVLDKALERGGWSSRELSSRVERSPPSGTCAACGAQLHRVLHAGANVDVCRGCGAAWLSRGGMSMLTGGQVRELQASPAASFDSRETIDAGVRAVSLIASPTNNRLRASAAALAAIVFVVAIASALSWLVARPSTPDWEPLYLAHVGATLTFPFEPRVQLELEGDGVVDTYELYAAEHGGMSFFLRHDPVSVSDIGPGETHPLHPIVLSTSAAMIKRLGGSVGDVDDEAALGNFPAIRVQVVPGSAPLHGAVWASMLGKRFVAVGVTGPVAEAEHDANLVRFVASFTADPPMEARKVRVRQMTWCLNRPRGRLVHASIGQRLDLWDATTVSVPLHPLDSAEGWMPVLWQGRPWCWFDSDAVVMDAQ